MQFCGILKQTGVAYPHWNLEMRLQWYERKD